MATVIQKKGYKNGYNDAIESIKKALSGESTSQHGPNVKDNLPPLPINPPQQNQQGNGGSSNSQNQQNQQQNPQQNQQGNGGSSNSQNQQNQQKKLSGKVLSQKTIDEISDANTHATGGGWISQKAGSEIAERAGYTGRDIAEESESKISNDWQKDTAEACAKGRGMGTNPNIIKTFEKFYKTNIDWKKELRKYVGKALSKHENTAKYGRRRNIAMTGDIRKYYKEGTPEDLSTIMFCIDTSGSVRPELLERLVSECWTIANQKKVKNSTYVFFDTKVYQVEHVKGDKMPKFKLKPGGGTDFEGLFIGLNDKFNKSNYELVMVFSDGDGGRAPAREKWMKNLIWVLYDYDFSLNNFPKKFPEPSTAVIHINTSDIK